MRIFLAAAALFGLTLPFAGCAMISRGTTQPWVEIVHETGTDYCVRFNLRTVPVSAISRLREPQNCVQECCWVYSSDAAPFVLDFNKGAQREIAAYGAAPIYSPATIIVEVSRPALTGIVTAKARPPVIERGGTVRLHASRVVGAKTAEEGPGLDLTANEGETDASSGEGYDALLGDEYEPDAVEEYFTRRKHAPEEAFNPDAAPVAPAAIPRQKSLFKNRTANLPGFQQEQRPASSPAKKPVKARKPPPEEELEPSYAKSSVVKFAQGRIEPLVKLEFDNAAKTAVQNGLLYKAGKVGWTVKPEASPNYRLFCNFYADMGDSAETLDRRMYPCGTWLVNMKNRQVTPFDERAKNIWH